MSTARGFYLAFFFFLSHNFDGDTSRKERRRRPLPGSVEDSGFLKQQAERRRERRRREALRAERRLGYQIEHRRASRASATVIIRRAREVRPFRQGKGGQYVRFDTVWAPAALAENRGAGRSGFSTAAAETARRRAAPEVARRSLPPLEGVAYRRLFFRSRGATRI